jgi:CO/xanthine dehydrogenase Mo-binding subunit
LDVVLPDMLWTKVLRSPLAHARIGRVDVSKAGQLRGVRASSREKISGAKISKSMIPMPILAEDVVRFMPTAAAIANVVEDAVGVASLRRQSGGKIVRALKVAKDEREFCEGTREAAS